ncbi:hypothetical protein [Jannaschia sp. LMIT008]|uniref:hypothetical protein n=1 Tax=Jannaschia maritima TaxID=3032585 RepID=UPI002811F2F2|nr:hypothetical protein [Jannaschia sp. LMIT008]
MILEDFAAPRPKAAPAPPPAAEPAAPPDRGFDEGYRQGWDDAAARIREDDLRIGIRAAARLETLAHTQRAAMALCLSQVEGVLAEVFDKVLPRAAERGFLPLVVEEAQAMMQDAEGRVLRISVAADAVAPLRAILDAAPSDGAAVKLIGDPALEPMQALLTGADQEREVDLTRLLDAMDAAFEGLRADNRKPDGSPDDE